MRPEGWEGILAAHIAEANSYIFQWGEHDCALWCADWIQKITGNDLAANLRGQYSTEEEARAILQSLGLSAWSELPDNHLPLIPVKKAARGDLVLHPAGMLGICDGAFAYFLRDVGVTRIAFTKCVKAWKVG
jgi:hypothetical protein